MTHSGYLGIDAGTQGLSVIYTNEQLEVLGTGEGGYEMVNGLGEGCYEQQPADWESALVEAMSTLRTQLKKKSIDFNVAAIGISGQMHGEVCADENGKSLGPVRLWCDSRNDTEGDELTKAFGVKMPKRITSARWLWTIRNRPEIAKKTRHLTTPSGWIAYCLTGQWNLGIGDAAGMFPIDQQTHDYNQRLMTQFDKLVGDNNSVPLADLLPKVKKVGEDAGSLSAEGAKLLGLSEGIPVSAAEGDQPAALAGSLIADAGTVSVSFGTSVCANSVGDRAFAGVDACIDHFCAPDGKPINMVWLRNGTTFMNNTIGMFAKSAVSKDSSGFDAIMPLVVNASPDCGGILALPFMDDEPGLGVSRGGTAMFIGLNEKNSTDANLVKAALLATIFNLRIGSEVLDQQGFPRTKIVLSGGLTKTPELSQLLADVFNVPVLLLDSAEEGTAWGATLMAKFRHDAIKGSTKDWGVFLADHQKPGGKEFSPDTSTIAAYQSVYQRYKRLLQQQGALSAAVE